MHGPVIAEILGGFLQPNPRQAIERLNEHRAFDHAAERQPCRVAALEMRQFVGQHTALLLRVQIGQRGLGQRDLVGSERHRTRQ